MCNSNNKTESHQLTECHHMQMAIKDTTTAATLTTKTNAAKTTDNNNTQHQKAKSKSTALTTGDHCL